MLNENEKKIAQRSYKMAKKKCSLDDVIHAFNAVTTEREKAIAGLFWGAGEKNQSFETTESLFHTIDKLGAFSETTIEHAKKEGAAKAIDGWIDRATMDADA